MNRRRRHFADLFYRTFRPFSASPTYSERLARLNLRVTELFEPAPKPSLDADGDFSTDVTAI